MSKPALNDSIAIVNYGMGNLHSAKKALQQVTEKTVFISSDADEILTAGRIVVPGVGAIRDCIAAIKAQQIDQVIAQSIAAHTPLLGICIGMQVLLSFSEENNGVECLGHFPQRVESFAQFSQLTEGGYKIPHMGWNTVAQVEHPLWQGIDDHSYFYFVHSYCASVDDNYTVGTCNYGIEFSAAVARDSVFAVQFHPEKSSANGLQLLSNFCQWRA